MKRTSLKGMPLVWRPAGKTHPGDLPPLAASIPRIAPSPRTAKQGILTVVGTSRGQGLNQRFQDPGSVRAHSQPGPRQMPRGIAEYPAMVALGKRGGVSVDNFRGSDVAILQLTDDWRLVSDEHQWTLQQATWVAEDSETGKRGIEAGYKPVSGRVPNWHGVRYYSHLSDGLENFVELHVRRSDAVGLGEIRAEICAVKAMVRRALEAGGIAA